MYDTRDISASFHGWEIFRKEREKKMLEVKLLTAEGKF